MTKYIVLFHINKSLKTNNKTTRTHEIALINITIFVLNKKKNLQTFNKDQK